MTKQNIRKEKEMEEDLEESQSLRNLVGLLRMDFKDFQTGSELPEAAAKRLAFVEEKIEGCLLKIAKISERAAALEEAMNGIGKTAYFAEKSSQKLEGEYGKLGHILAEISERLVHLEKKG